MGPVLAVVGSFVAAVFGFGAAATGAYLVGVQIARLGLLALASKALAPKINLDQAAQSKLLTVKDPVAPQQFMYGQDMVSGPLQWANTGGTNNRDLHRVVANLGHEVESVVAYRIDGTDIVVGGDIAAETGSVTGGKFDGVLDIDRKLGTTTQTAFSALVAAFASLWTSAHRFRGWAVTSFEMSIVAGSEDAFEEGIPQNLRTLYRGKQIYDPRRYSLNADPDFATAKLVAGSTPSNRTRWFGNTPQSVTIDSAFTESAGVLSHTDNDDNSENIFSERFPVDTTKRYTVEVDARQTAGDRTHYLFVCFYDAAGDVIDFGGNDGTGWRSVGAFNYFAVDGQVFAGSWTTYTIDFGSGGTASIPTGAVEMCIGALLTRTGAVGTNTTIDLRDFSVFEGTTRHSLTDQTTWEWSENPALQLADHFRWDRVGLGEEDDRVDWPLCIDAAQVSDELVAIPTAATQKRYTSNFTFLSTTPRQQVKEILENAMLGRSIFSQGKWKMWAGAALTADVTLTEANLRGSIQLQASTGAKERFNRVRGKFVDPSRDYAASSYPEQRSSTYETQDGRVIYEVVDFPAANTDFEAQRGAIVTLKRSRNQRVMVFEGNMACFRIQPGTVVTINIAELGFVGEKFFVTDWSLAPDYGVNLTMVEEDDTVWTAPLEGDYSTRTATGALVFGNIGVPAPTGLTATAVVEGVRLAWTNPIAGSFSRIEIWGADENVRGSATLVEQVTSSPYTETIVLNERIRYYWVRAVNAFGQTSDYEPDLTTTTASAAPLPLSNNFILDPDFDLSAALSADSFWRGEDLQTGTPGSPDTPNVAVFNSGGGANSSNAIDLVIGNYVDPGAAGGAWITTNKRHRFNFGSFEWRIRYATTGVFDFANATFAANAKSYDSPTSTTLRSQSGLLLELPDTGGAFQTITVRTDAQGTDLGQFWDFELRVAQLSSPGIDETLTIDSVFVYQVVDSGSPTLVVNAAYTFTAGDHIKTLEHNDSTARIWTVPNQPLISAGTIFPMRQIGTGRVTIRGASGVTVIWFDGATAGGFSRTAGDFFLDDPCEATLQKHSDTLWYLRGDNIASA